MSKETDLLRRAAELLRENYNLKSETAANLDALADQMERAEPVAYEHAYRKIAGGRRYWTVAFEGPTDHPFPDDGYEWIKSTPLYAHPAPEVQRDAERYRWLRAKENQDNDAWNAFGPYSSSQEIDAAIDAAMQEPKP